MFCEILCLTPPPNLMFSISHALEKWLRVHIRMTESKINFDNFRKNFVCIPLLAWRSHTCRVLTWSMHFIFNFHLKNQIFIREKKLYSKSINLITCIPMSIICWAFKYANTIDWDYIDSKQAASFHCDQFVLLVVWRFWFYSCQMLRTLCLCAH